MYYRTGGRMKREYRPETYEKREYVFKILDKIEYIPKPIVFKLRPNFSTNEVEERSKVITFINKEVA
jgi:hypothetical protein